PHLSPSINDLANLHFALLSIIFLSANISAHPPNNQYPNNFLHLNLILPPLIHLLHK
ncbi:hypothetical protein K445DRAFT_347706, partial [Daldinia sp. EC12]